MADDKKFATGDDLGTAEIFEDIELPSLKKWVRVRYLDTAEVARLQMLPDLVGFAELVVAMTSNVNAPDKKKAVDVNPAELAAENYRYEGALAHLAVMNPEADVESIVMCDECGWPHVPSLWTRIQSARLQPADLDAITLTALKAQSLRVVRPFSTDPTPSDSPVPAASGASTPPTSL